MLPSAFLKTSTNIYIEAQTYVCVTLSLTGMGSWSTGMGGRPILSIKDLIFFT